MTLMSSKPFMTGSHNRSRCRSSTTRPARKSNGIGWNYRAPLAGWDGYGKKAFLLAGSLSHSSKWRGVLCESMEQPQLADAQHRVALRLGGLTQDWRFDRMSTVVHPAT